MLADLATRVREFQAGGPPEPVLAEDGLALASRVLELATAGATGPESVDADALQLVALYYQGRSVAWNEQAAAGAAPDEAARHSEADFQTSIGVYGLLFLVDHRRVPREFWPHLIHETGRDPWADPLDHATDLILDADEQSDGALRDEAIALLRADDRPGERVRRDSLLGNALLRRAGDPDAAAAERIADTDAAIALLATIAAGPEPSPDRRCWRHMSLAEAHVQRFELGGSPADLDAADAAFRTALDAAEPGTAAYARACGGVGAVLGRRAELVLRTPGDATAPLREATEWLRRAVDADPSPDGGAARSNLRRIMAMRIRETARAARATAARPPDRTEADTAAQAHGSTTHAPDRTDTDPAGQARDARTPGVTGGEPVGQVRASEGEHAGAADVDHVTARAQALVELAWQVRVRVLPESDAVRQVTDLAFELPEGSVALAVRSAGRVERAEVSGERLIVLRLALAATERRWGATPDSPWWTVADTYVETVRHSLAEEPDGARFAGALAVAVRQMDLLSPDRGRERDELAGVCFAAGLLHLTPYTASMSGLSFDSAHSLWRERERRQEVLRSGDDEDRPRMPPPAAAAEQAVRHLERAVGLARGHERGRMLKALAEAWSFLGGMRQEPTERQFLLACREAFDLLDPVLDPLGYLFLLRGLNIRGELALPADLADLLPLPLATVLDRHGLRDAAAVFTDALQLLEEAVRPDLEAALLAAADVELPRLWNDAQRRRRWMSEAHLLPDNRLGCSPALRGMPALVDAARAAAAGWTPAELAATLIHVAGHTSSEDAEELGRALLREARRLAPQLWRSHADALHYLDAGLAFNLGLRAREGSEQLAAVAAFGDSAFAYALCGQSDLALDSLRAGLHSAGACAADTTRLAVIHLVPAAAQLGAPDDEATAWQLHAVQRELLRLAMTGRPDATVVAAVHQLVKGLAFTGALHAPGPQAFSAGLRRELAAARAGEAALDGPLPDFDLPGGAETAMLFYAGTGEAEPETDAEAVQRNRQRAADRRVSAELTLSRGRGRLPVILSELQQLLEPETVLISLALGDTRAGQGQPPVATVHGLAVTRDWVRHRTVLLRDFETGLMRIQRGEHVLTLSPVALDVAALRADVVADPLHRPVTRAAQRALAEQPNAFLAGFLADLPGWHAEGRRHLCVWAHGPLHYVPFHLLTNDGRTLADDWVVSQVHSLAQLPEPEQAPPGEGDGPTPGPSRGRAQREHTGAEQGRGAVVFASGRGGAAHGLAAEDGLEEHAAQVAAATGSEAVLGAAATPQRFLAALAQARYVHVAAHGAHNEWAPWFQCLYLSPGPDGEGRVFAHDILGVDLRGVELVTLSACESALGRFDVNDNLRGLPAAFLAAGAAAVVGCLWPVHPQVATDFFGELYRLLATDPDRRAAFAAAQRATRDRHPAYRDWGAFVLIGDWRSTPTSEEPP